jgi:hypothetical protein
MQGKTLRFFSGTPGVVRVTTPDTEIVYSLSLPDFAATAWTPPAAAATGLPSKFARPPVFAELWQWLAVLGGALLLVEWMWFGRFRKTAGKKSFHRGLPSSEPLGLDVAPPRARSEATEIAAKSR